MKGRIFINYRREISAAAAGRLSGRLAPHFDHDRLFMDIDSIEPGVDFVKILDEQVARCSAFIAIIGPGWADLKNAEGHRRLDQPNDYVRIEIESALKRDRIRVIPVLVDGAPMPTAEQLPDSLKPLSRRNAVTLSHQRFNAEVDELAEVLQRDLGLDPKRAITLADVENQTRQRSKALAKYAISSAIGLVLGLSLLAWVKPLTSGGAGFLLFIGIVLANVISVFIPLRSKDTKTVSAERRKAK